MGRNHLAGAAPGSPFARRLALVIAVTAAPFGGVSMRHGFQADRTEAPLLEYGAVLLSFLAASSFSVSEKLIGTLPETPLDDGGLLAGIPASAVTDFTYI
jgi:hypothetical protein